MLNKIRLIFLAAICLICANNLSAQVYEGFNYSSGSSLNGLNGGTGWNSGWVTGGTVTLTNPALSYTALTTVGNVSLGDSQVGGSGSSISRYFAPINGTAGTSIRTSFLIKPPTLSSSTFVSLNILQPGGTSVGIYRTQTGKWAAAGSTSTTNATAGTTYYLVVQIDFNATNNRVRLWINPPALNNLATDNLPATPNVDTMIQPLSSINGVDWQSTGGASIDEIRLAKVPTGMAKDYFGSSVDVWTDVNNSLSYFVVGAPRCDMSGNIASPATNGKAYIFTMDGMGMVKLVATLSASDATAGDCFGRSVTIDDEIVVVGADKADDSAGTDQGKAYLFKQVSGVWTQFKILKSSDAAAGDRFGNDVEISGDKLIIGAFQAEPAPNSPSITDQGQAYIFEQNQGGTNNWGEKSILVAGEPSGGIQANDQFGYCVAIDSNDKALVGAIGKDQILAVDKGAVYAFARQNSTPFWTQTNKLTDPNGAAGFYFGTSVAIDPISKTGIVGAFGTKNPTNSEGKAFLFDGNSSWTPAGTFSSTLPNQGDGFGWSVAIWGNAVIVGEYYGENSTATPQNSGAAYFSRKLGSVWTPMQQRIGNPTASVDYFSNSVAIFGNFSIIGAPFSDVGANADQGRAFIYTGSVTNPTQYYVLTN